LPCAQDIREIIFKEVFKVKRILVAGILFVLLHSSVASAALAKDPFVVHRGPFGPVVAGLQLGMKYDNLADVLSMAIRRATELFDLARAAQQQGRRPAYDVQELQLPDFNIRAYQGDNQVGYLESSIIVDQNGKYDIKVKVYRGPIFPDRSKLSLKEQGEFDNWTFDNFIAVMEQYPTWIIRCSGDSELAFARYGDSFRLVSFTLSPLAMLIDGFERRETVRNSGDYGRELALFYIEKYGADDFTGYKLGGDRDFTARHRASDDDFLYKDAEGGFVVFTSAYGVSLLATNKDAIYPVVFGDLLAYTPRNAKSKSTNNPGIFCIQDKLNNYLGWIPGYDSTYGFTKLTDSPFPKMAPLNAIR
jgi:hypothetical protein